MPSRYESTKAVRRRQRVIRLTYLGLALISTIYSVPTPPSRPLELGQTQASNGALVQYYEQVDIRADEWSITTFDLTILPHFRTEFAHRANKDSEIGAQHHLSSGKTIKTITGIRKTQTAQTISVCVSCCTTQVFIYRICQLVLKRALVPSANSHSTPPCFPLSRRT